MADAGSIQGRMTLDDRGWHDALRRIQSSSRDTASTLNSVLTGAIGGVTAALTNFAGQALKGAVEGIKGFLAESVKLAASNEQTAISFTVMAGSAEKAKQLMKGLRDFAATTPFQIGEINSAAKSLMAFGFQVETMVPLLRRLGDVSAGTGRSIQDLAVIYGKIAGKGRLTGEELQQLTESGVPMLRELSSMLNRSTADIQKMVSEGQIGFSDVRRALQRMTDEGGIFYNLTREQSESAAGLYSTLLDTIDEVKRSLGEGLIRDDAGKAILTDLIREAEKLKPIFEDAGIALAEAMRQAQPVMRSLMQTAIAWLDEATGRAGKVRDTNRLGPSNAAEVGAIVGRGGDDAAEVDRVYRNAARVAADKIQEIQRSTSGGDYMSSAEHGKAAMELYQAEKELQEAMGRGTVDVVKAVERAIAAIRKVEDVPFVQRKAPEATDSSGVTRIIDTIADTIAEERRRAAANQPPRAAPSPTPADPGDGPAAAPSGSSRSGKKPSVEPVTWGGMVLLPGTKFMREAQREAQEIQNSLDRAANNRLDAVVTTLRSQGRELEAELTRLKGVYERDVRDAKTAEERKSLDLKYEADRRAAIRRDEESKKRPTYASSPAQPFQELSRAERASLERARRELTRLELRADRGLLQEGDDARMGRLYDRLRLPQGQIAAQLEAATASLQRSVPTTSRDGVTVVAPAIDEKKLAKAVADAVTPVIDERIRQVQAGIQAARLAQQVLGNL